MSDSDLLLLENITAISESKTGKSGQIVRVRAAYEDPCWRPKYTSCECTDPQHKKDGWDCYFSHVKWKKDHDWNSSVIQQSGLFWNEDEIYEEFDILKSIIEEWWYKRYEISNFAAVGKSSVHNRVYWEMEDYLWLWLSASSFINGRSPYFGAVVEKLKKLDSLLRSEWHGIRWTNTPYFPKYIWNERLAESEITPLSEKDYLIESFFLWLRTDRWVSNIEKYELVLMEDWQEKIRLYEENWFLKIRENGFVLTDEWMDCYNGIITELLEDI